MIELGDNRGYEVYYAVLTGTKKSGGSLLDDQKKMLSDPKKMAQFGLEQGVGFVPFGGIAYGGFKMLTKDDVSPVRAAAARVLIKDPDPKSGLALVDATLDKSWIVRMAALDSLARRGDFKNDEQICRTHASRVSGASSDVVPSTPSTRVLPVMKIKNTETMQAMSASDSSHPVMNCQAGSVNR